MARFRSSKRSKELQRKAKHEAKEVRKKERQERTASGEADPDIDWSQAVGITPPPGTVTSAEPGADDIVEAEADEVEDETEEA